MVVLPALTSYHISKITNLKEKTEYTSLRQARSLVNYKKKEKEQKKNENTYTSYVPGDFSPCIWKLVIQEKG